MKAYLPLALSTCMLAGCLGAPKSAVQKPIPPQTMPTTPQPIAADGLELALGELSLSGQRYFAFAPVPGARDSSNYAVQAIFYLNDPSGRHPVRLAPETHLDEIVDAEGRSLLPGTSPTFSMLGLHAGEFAVPGTKAGGGDTITGVQKLLVKIPVASVPTGLQIIRGVCEIEVVESTEMLRTPMPALDIRTDLGLGLSGTVRLLEKNLKSGALQSFSMELECAAGGNAPIVQSLTVVDGGQHEVATKLVEEVQVGSVTRRRFVSVSPMYAAQNISSPKELRIGVFSSVRRARIPFQWGPVDLAGGSLAR